MRRSTSIAVDKENPRLTSSFFMNKSHTQDTDSFCFDKLESMHFESQEVQTQIEGLISKMKNDVNLQNIFQHEKGYLKIKKDDFVFYYNQLKDIYKSTKKIGSNWDGLFEEFSTKHSQSIAKKNKEMESLTKHYKYKIKALEFEKKSALEALKNDLLKREQEVLDSVNTFINSLKSTKKFWSNNLTELYFCVQEQSQSISYISNHKVAKLKAFSDEIDSIFGDTSPQKKGLGNTLNMREGMSSERSRKCMETSKQPFSDLLNMLSPINQELPNIGLKLLNKSSEGSNVKSAKPERDSHAIETSNNSYDDLFPVNKAHGKNEHSSPSMGREESGWDPNLEDEESTEGPEIERVEKALDVLFQNGVLEPHAISMFEQIMQTTNDCGIDREIQMNLFKDHIKLQMKRQKRHYGGPNQEPQAKKIDTIDETEEDKNRLSPPSPAASLRKKPFRGTSTAVGTRLNRNLTVQQIEELSHENSDFKETVSQVEAPNTEKVSQTQKSVAARKEDSKKNKSDISLTDLMGVKDYSFVLESPLSSHISREEFSMSFPQFQHVDKDDLLKADSLPVTMKEIELSKILPDRNKHSGQHEESSHNSYMINTRKKDQPASGEKQAQQHTEIKIIEESRNSSGNSQNTNVKQPGESCESSDKSSPYISSQRRKLLQEDDTQLEWEANIDSKREMDSRREGSRKTKTTPSIHIECSSLSSTSNILKDKTNEQSSLELYQNTQMDKEEIVISLPQTAKDLRNRSSTINSIDVKLESINMTQNSVGRSRLVKENPNRRHTNKSNLRTSHFTGSGQTRISTKANTGFNREIYYNENSSMNRTEPIIRLIDNHDFSNMVETEEGSVEKISHNYLNNSYPPYSGHMDKGKEEAMTKFPMKRNANYTSLKTVETTDSGWGSKNLMSNKFSGNLQSFSSLRGTKGFTNHRSRSDIGLWTKPMNIIPELDKSNVQKIPKKSR